VNPGWIISFVSLEITGLVLVLGVVIWAIRKEGVINAHSTKLAENDTAHAALAARVEAKAAAHNETKIEVVRLQEQIGHLTRLIERWGEPDPPKRRPRPTT
jgi:hypothetical protein